MAAVNPVAHRASAPIGSAIPAVLRTVADLSPELMAAAQPVWHSGPVAELWPLEQDFWPTHPTRDRTVAGTAVKISEIRPEPARR